MTADAAAACVVQMTEGEGGYVIEHMELSHLYDFPSISFEWVEGMGGGEGGCGVLMILHAVGGRDRVCS